uniref:large ribosomal subunit protein mL48 isoform X2 n=1 Tax=Myxine glutinosa TaxID=7769 RepID=UPI0035902ED8
MAALFGTVSALVLRGAQPLTTPARLHRSRPTHGIGRYDHLIAKDPQENVGKRKRRILDTGLLAPVGDTAYGTLNILTRGHDVTLVEHFSSYVHYLCKRLGTIVCSTYALPTQHVEVYLDQLSGKQLYDATINTHGRVVQIGRMPSSLAPVLLQQLLVNLPEGVDLMIKPHTDEDFQLRFKTRPEMSRLQEELKR